jgi:hypothetical protein
VSVAIGGRFPVEAMTALEIDEAAPFAAEETEETEETAELAALSTSFNAPSAD